MTKKKVTVVDYGAGNLYSVQRALECCGAENIVISSSPADVADADLLILPGVGAFEDGMQGLRGKGLIEPIVSYAASGRPLLGICLGMQMLATKSEEFGSHDGLNIIPGRVVAIPRQQADGTVRKIPFIGWTSLSRAPNADWEASILAGMPERSSVYLVHSYYMQPDNPEHLLATYDYNGCCVCAAIQRGNVTGLQFHPEKSGEVGLKLLRQFLLR